MALKLVKGQQVTINVPFTYTIGEEGAVTGKILETIEDCKAEVQAEFDRGFEDEIYMVVEG